MGGHVQGNRSSLSKLVIQDTSDPTNAMARYSASMQDQATTFCFREDQLIREFPCAIMNNA